MRKILFIIMMAFTISVNAQQVYDEQRNTMEQVDQAIAKAKAEGKFVCCQVGGNWCPWCLKFANFITDSTDIKAVIDANYVYEHVNYSSKNKDNEILKQTMKRLGNPMRFGFPVMVILDGEGKIVHIQDSWYLEEGKSYNKEKVMAFFRNWTPKAVQDL